MKKKILGFIVTGLCAFALIFTINTAQAQEASIDETGGPVIGAKQCVCKGSSCESSAFISLRRKCGKEPCGGSPTNVPGIPNTGPVVCS